MGVDLEYVYGEIVDVDTDALEVDIERVAASATVIADTLVDLTDAWFIDIDALVASEDPEHVVYVEQTTTASRGSSMRFVLVTCCLVLAVAACVGASV